MTATRDTADLQAQVEADADLAIGQVHERLHNPSDVTDAVRRAWSDYLGTEAAAELRHNVNVATLAELVTELIHTSALTYRRERARAYLNYLDAVGHDVAPSDLTATPRCLAYREDGTEGVWMCTRPKGHDGDHAACGTGSHPMATWEA